MAPITLCVHDLPFKDCEECNPQLRRNGHNPNTDKAGDCDLCGEWAGKLVDGVCQPCIEFYHLAN